ncbi:MAG: tRNA lysidine(34) synthetase TilS, partial [Armatimonadetes bacterium]|nr:tRNA lysidine(34) synthetase TilS [Armatimonadota bacterium]
MSNFAKTDALIRGLDLVDYIPAPEAVRFKVATAITEFHMLEEGEPVVVAVSGGPDSLTLLHILHRLSAEKGWKLTVAHLNHCLRGEEADEDEAFVREVAEKLGLPFQCQRVNVRELAKKEKMSLAQAGRTARYRFFAEVLQRVGSYKVAMGHTASDVVETLLLNLFRGTGVDGLMGVPPVSPLTFANGLPGQIVRPLIFCWREETALYSRIHRLQPRQDQSNRDIRQPRNWIRHRLLPMVS